MPSIHPHSRMPSREHREHTNGPPLPSSPLVISLSHSFLSIFSSFSRSSLSRSFSSCRRPSVGGLCVRAIRPACNLYLPSSLGSLCTSICPSIRKPYLRQGNKRVNLDIMAATVAAHKTIVQDISLASPFRVSAPLYRHARFSFFLFFSSSSSSLSLSSSRLSFYSRSYSASRGVTMHVEFRRNDNAIRARYATDASFESEGGNMSSDISVPKLVGRLESQIIVHAWHLFFVAISFAYVVKS